MCGGQLRDKCVVGEGLEGREQQKTTSRDLVSFALVKELTVVASYCYHDALRTVSSHH